MKPIHSSLISSVVSYPQVTVRGSSAGFWGLSVELSYRTQASILLPAGGWTLLSGDLSRYKPERK